MNRLLALLTVLAVAGVAVADGLPPPPPKGKKYVTVNHEVLVSKDLTGYVFVQQTRSFPGGGGSYTKPELNATKAVAIPTARRTSVTLFAVPQDAAKEYKTDKELFDALGANQIKGAVKIGFGSTATVPDAVKENTVKWTHTITAVDAQGIKTKVEGDGYEAPKTPKGPLPSGEEEEETSGATVSAPRGGLWVAGLAASVAVMLGGMWFVGRARRKA